SNTEVLVKKLQKSGLFSQEQLEPILNNREELINECLALSHFATSRLRMATPTEGGSDFQNFLKFFAQENAKRDAAITEQRKIDAAAIAEQRRIDAAKIEQLNLDREAAEKRYVQERNEERERRNEERERENIKLKEERDRHNEQMELLRQQFETARRDDKTQTE